MQVSEIDEFALIDRLNQIITPNHQQSIVGMGDDGAVIDQQAGYQTIVATDMLIEDIHFQRAKISPRQLGAKALAVNISDIVAMGGKPTYATIALGLPPTTEVNYIEKIYRGINELAQEYNLQIIGGDTTASPNNLVINLNLLGKVKAEEYLLRSTAQVGDQILLTNSIGQSKAGLELLLNNQPELTAQYPELIKAHLEPTPRLKELTMIKDTATITALNDISDGLASELIEITSASQVGAKIYQQQLPITRSTKAVAAQLGESAIEYGLWGGEDYELLLTVPASESKQVKTRVEAKLNTTISIIGEIVPQQEGVKLITPDQIVNLDKGGYNHFR
ncbi:MAG: thiamine-phosphate kinase [Bacillota bacterium]